MTSMVLLLSILKSLHILLWKEVWIFRMPQLLKLRFRSIDFHFIILLISDEFSIIETICKYLKWPIEYCLLYVLSLQYVSLTWFILLILSFLVCLSAVTSSLAFNFNWRWEQIFDRPFWIFAYCFNNWKFIWYCVYQYHQWTVKVLVEELS